ncbi:hypothetical protein LguiA_021415 [Lonicera macranthoides]
MSLLNIINVWKCFVLSGVDVTLVRFWPTKVLIVKLLPTSRYPTNPTVTLVKTFAWDPD